MITPTSALNVIGQRGIIPSPSLINTAFELIDRRNGDGIVIRWWDELQLGPVPSQSELDLASNPLLSLHLAATEAGFTATCQTVNASYTGLLSWRCIDPDGIVYTEQENAVNGGGSWEVETGKLGDYTVAVWATGFGYVEEQWNA